MSVRVIQKPTDGALYCLNQVPDFILATDEHISVWISVFGDNTAFFNGGYQPDYGGMVRISFKGLYENWLKTELPSSDIEQQYQYNIAFHVTIRSSQTITQLETTYYVANSRLNRDQSYAAFVDSHFLTNQPKEKHITMDSPEWLTYYDVNGSLSLYAKVYPVGSLGVDYRITRNNQGVITANVSCQKIKSLISTQQQLQGYYDIILKTSGGTVKATQRYIVNRATGREHYFLFVNALGGIDTLICRGDNTLQPEATFNTGRLAEKRIQLDDTEDYRKWQQSMRLPWKQRNWIHELLTRKAKAAKYDTETQTLDEILVTGIDFNIGDRETLYSASFTYMMADNDETASDIKRETDDMLRLSSLRNAEIIITEEQPEEEEPGGVDDPEEEVEP